MTYEEANAHSWTAVLAREAHAFMVDLQARLCFWEVLAENDQAFIRRLREIGADVAWAFEDLLAVRQPRELVPGQEYQNERDGMVFMFGVIDTDDPESVNEGGTDQPPDDPDDEADPELGRAA